MCAECGWSDYHEDIKESIQLGLESEFMENVIEFIEHHRHITPKQKAGVDRWLQNWRSRYE